MLWYMVHGREQCFFLPPFCVDSLLWQTQFLLLFFSLRSLISLLLSFSVLSSRLSLLFLYLSLFSHGLSFCLSFFLLSYISFSAFLSHMPVLGLYVSKTTLWSEWSKFFRWTGKENRKKRHKHKQTTPANHLLGWGWGRKETTKRKKKKGEEVQKMNCSHPLFLPFSFVKTKRKTH